MNKYTLLIIFFHLACSKEDSDKFVFFDKYSNLPAPKKVTNILPEKHDYKLTEKSAFKKWQNSLSLLERKTNDSLLKTLCSLSKKVQFLKKQDLAKRALLFQTRPDNIFPIGIYFNPQKDTIPPIYQALYDPNINIIMVNDFQNTNVFGELDTVSLAIVYAHELMHYYGFSLGLPEKKDHEIADKVEKNVLYSFIPSLKDSAKICECCDTPLKARKFIDKEYGRYGLVTTLLLKKILLKKEN